MKKVILEEIKNMKYLLGYKRGVVISEQQTPQSGTIPPSNQSAANKFKDSLATANQMAANSPFAPKTQSSQDSANELERQQGAAAQGFKDFQAKYQQQTPSPAAATGTPATGTPATGTPAAGSTQPASGAPQGAEAPATTTPVTPIKIGVKYPSIEVLQNLLNTKNQAGLNPDGKYGPKTAASVLAALQKLPVNSTETKTNDTVLADPSKAATVTANVAQTGGNTNGTAAGTTPAAGTAPVAGTAPAAGTTAGSGVVSVNANDIIG